MRTKTLDINIEKEIIQKINIKDSRKLDAKTNKEISKIFWLAKKNLALTLNLIKFYI